MLTLYTASGAMPLSVDDYYIKELASGLDELCFSISIWDPLYVAIQEESSIKEESADGSAFYLVKAIDGGGSTANIKCQIDLDEWKTALMVPYNSGSARINEIVNAVRPDGWSVVNNSGIMYRRTIQLDAATPMDVLEQCRSTFPGQTFRFDNVAKTVTITNMEGGENLGAFLTRDLNLKKNDYKGKSTGFATRLYAYGKDGLSFADINGGKPYVENHTYSSRVICAYWSDERYTIAANLLLDAQAKLDAMAVPQRSFDCDVADLAATDPSKYGYLSFPLFSVASLIDQTRNAGKVEHRVVERWRHPYHPEKNKVVFSTAAPRIQSQVAQIVQAVSNPNSDFNQQQAAYINALTTAILGAKGGAVRLLDTDDDGVPDTLYIADDPDPAQAVHVWRFNYQGWGASTNGYNGPFTLGAAFQDGGTLFANVLKVLNINASNISTGTLSADRIAANSIAVSKLTGTIGTSGWELNLTNGTFTIGTISADNITAGTIDASKIDVTNLDASNISTGTLNAESINVTNINGANIKTGTIGSGPLASNAVINEKIGSGAVSYGKTSFTGTLDQVGTNKADIAAINALFVNSLTVSGLTVNGALWVNGGTGAVKYTKFVSPSSASMVLGY